MAERGLTPGLSAPESMLHALPTTPPMSRSEMPEVTQDHLLGKVHVQTRKRPFLVQEALSPLSVSAELAAGSPTPQSCSGLAPGQLSW